MSKILIVDDIEENRYLLEVLLKGNGYEVVTATNGAEALDKARRNPPDLIVADILMPVMDGFMLCREWKQDDRLSGIPFVFYTATYTDPKNQAFGLNLGAEMYLIKPMEPDQLMTALREALRKSTKNRLEQTGTTMKNETTYLREYNETLFRKLEDKMFQLEETNQRLTREIAEHRQAQVRLQRLSTAIENAAECIVITDAGGMIEYVNPAFEKITGFSAEETIGRKPNIMSSGRHNDMFYQTLWKTISEGKPWKGDLTNKSKSGERIEFETIISPIHDSSEGITGFVSIMRDVTEQKKLEAQLTQSQKMEAIGTLAGGIAHDFNNILSAIMGYTQLALWNISEDGPIRNHLEAALRSCDRAKTLVEQILTFSRKAEQKRVLTDLRTIVKEVIKLLRASLPSTIDVRVRLEPECVTVMADPIQIHQVLLNICTNAAYAMRNSGGLLELVLKKAEFDENTASQYPGLTPGEYELLSISDTGCGMDKETRARMFEPFFTTKKPGEGTGLGLSVAHGIIQSHGGIIGVYSEPGQGSTFSIYLPVVEGEPEKTEKIDTRPLPTGTESILFIDDEKDLADIGRQILEPLGYRVAALTSSREALEKFKNDPARFDLVITDQTMPQLTGIELAAEMLKIRPDLPIIICTGFSVHISEEKAKAIGIRQVLMKPLVVKEVARVIRSVLEEGDRSSSRSV